MTNIEFILFISMSFVISRIPYLGLYVNVIYTLFHEIGHALVALLTGGGVKKIKLFSNTEGVAETKGFYLGSLLTTLGGYPFASFVSYILFYLFLNNKYEVIFYSLIVVMVLSLILWIRNLYGFLWIVSFTLILLLIFYIGNEHIIKYSMMFIGSIMFVEAIYASLEIFILSIKKPNEAGDATSMKKKTLISSRFWGFLFLIQALYFGYITTKLLFHI